MLKFTVSRESTYTGYRKIPTYFQYNKASHPGVHTYNLTCGTKHHLINQLI